MAYCTAAQVKSIVDTDMSDAEVGALIDFIDELMDIKLDTGSLSATILFGISQAWTAYRVMLKDPAAERIADLSANREANLKLLKAEYEMLIELVSGSIAFVMTSSPIEG